MTTHITIKLFATLNKYTPATETYPVKPGTMLSDLLQQLGVPVDEVKLIFINGKKGDLTSTLQGGERVGVFPPVGG